MMSSLKLANRGTSQQRRAALKAGAAVCAAIPLSASAQKGYPDRPIRMVIGFAAGGGTDAVLRILAGRMAEELGVPVVVDNKVGANGNIANEIVAKSPPDGYTFVYNTSSMVLSALLGSGMSYDYTRDLAPVALVANIPLLLTVHPDVPARTARELVDHIRANPDKLAYATASVGNITHLATLQMLDEIKGKALHVPYKAEAPAIVDAIGGQVQFYMGTANALIPQVKTGKLRALAIGSRSRVAMLPDVPTLSETILPNIQFGAWSGVMAPANTPDSVIQKVNAAILTSLRDPKTRQKIEESGAEVLGSTAKEYGEFIASESGRWGRIIKAGNIKTGN